MRNWVRQHPLAFRSLMSLSTMATMALVVTVFDGKPAEHVLEILGAGAGMFVAVMLMQRDAGRNGEG